ncbi:helix-turn-helix DNA binding domain protein [Bacillus phage SalinJah]|uniref:Helix-turn-helix DNA binding domain protein n=1 Tax=Bacillus phage SalinJah TaxID=1837830 RepID=A0A173GBS6_9CAUD|nr:DNA binding protein [Bacillus phage SalinJah]ANH50772.1 helix-turn-helix DNA binding domain protein [Bacillus phage SalinJah]
MAVIDMEKDVKKETLIQGAVTASWGSEEPLTEELEDIVASKYVEGVAVTKIMKTHKLSAGKVYRILRRKGIEKRRAPYKRDSAQRMLELTDRQKKDIADAYIREVPVLVIAKNFNINYQTVYDILDERAIVRRTEKGVHPNQGRRAIISDEPKAIVATLPSGKTAREIIEDLKSMKEAGEQLRAGIITEPETGQVYMSGRTVVVRLDIDEDEYDSVVVKKK